MDDLLRIEDLRVYYHERSRVVKAVDGVSLTLARGNTLAIVGESGCGKTTLGMAVLDLVPEPGRIESGQIIFDGRDLLQLKPDALRRVRGREISMIFQDPTSGLNPVLPVGAQVEEVIRTHLDVPKKESRARAREALAAQGLAEPDRIMGSYPFQLSGGMCQRVMIAIATALRPRIIIADEPTSALDVTVQAGILQELQMMKEEIGASVLLITHDLGIVAQMADDVAVMYAGRIVEYGSARGVFARPSHPYTAALLAARPRPDTKRERLQVIPGTPPDMGALAGTCAFLERCTKAVSACRADPWPGLRAVAPGHDVACYNPVYHADD